MASWMSNHKAKIRNYDSQIIYRSTSQIFWQKWCHVFTFHAFRSLFSVPPIDSSVPVEHIVTSVSTSQKTFEFQSATPTKNTTADSSFHKPHSQTALRSISEFQNRLEWLYCFVLLRAPRPLLSRESGGRRWRAGNTVTWSSTRPAKTARSRRRRGSSSSPMTQRPRRSPSGGVLARLEGAAAVSRRVGHWSLCRHDGGRYRPRLRPLSIATALPAPLFFLRPFNRLASISAPYVLLNLVRVAEAAVFRTGLVNRPYRTPG